MASSSEPKPRKTFTLRLTRLELTHLRDLFSVMLPPDLKATLSQELATSQDRSLIEARLWQKVTATCREAEVPLDDDAPDFVVAASSAPAIGVFEIAADPPEAGEDEESTKDDTVFGAVNDKLDGAVDEEDEE